MIHRTRIEKNTFYDSIILMNATQRLQERRGVISSLIVMGTESNMEIIKEMGFFNDITQTIGPNDLVIVCSIEDEQVWNDLRMADLFIQPGRATERKELYTDSTEVLADHPEVNIAVISVDNRFAAFEAEKTLEMGLSTILFSSDIPTVEERRLKEIAFRNNVLLMGPDCGVCNINGKSFVLASNTNPGPVGLVGPSGSGLQELSAVLAKSGIGISQAIGTGGYDLHPDVGGLTTKAGISCLDQDEHTEIIILFYKKTDFTICDDLCRLLQTCSKPIIVCSFGEASEYWRTQGIIAYETMDETARAVAIILHEETTIENSSPFFQSELEILSLVHSCREKFPLENRHLKGVFGAGTFSAQLQTIFSRAGYPIFSNKPFEGGSLLGLEMPHEHVCIDIGAEEFTSGRAHPVIDPLPYGLQIRRFFEDEDTGILLVDVILGPACHGNPAQFIVDSVAVLRKTCSHDILCVASVCGTEEDPQVLSRQIAILEKAGFIVMPTSAQAARFCALLFAENPEELMKDWRLTFPDLKAIAQNVEKQKIESTVNLPAVCCVVNIGSEYMGQALTSQGVQVYQVIWKPPSGGDPEVYRLLRRIQKNTHLYEKIKTANKKAYDTLVGGEPVWIDVALAGEVVPGFEKNMILHTGPLMDFSRMLPAHRNGIIGGALFERLADTEEEAVRKILNREIKIFPGVDWGVPSGGMAPTTFSMPVIVVEDRKHAAKGFCPIQEGPSYQALRWGVYDEVVEERLTWFKTVLTPCLSGALKRIGGIQLKSVIAKSMLMGDENHSRETSTSLLLVSELAAEIAGSGLAPEDLKRIFSFFHSADRFALHVCIAGAASVLKSLVDIPYSTVMSAMCANGVIIGIKMSGTSNLWFTAPSPIIKGRYLNPAWTEDDTVPLAGDSTMVEVYGLGGLSAAASPAVTLLAGGNVDDAIRRTKDMWKISLGKHIHFGIPLLDFEGAPACVDVMKVIETGIVPQSHAGIILKKGGQAGAGVAEIPMQCFIQAFKQFVGSLPEEELNK
jgi:succinyl-CoA synthetase alpha subunit